MGEIIGRFHPLIVHLPIGILMLVFIMELASRTSKYAYIKNAIPFTLKVAIGSALIALFTGWIMPKEGEFDERLIGFHFWSSVAMTVSAVFVYLLLIQKQEKYKRFYFPMLLVSMILLGVTGHYGGSLTHGEGHLTQGLESKQVAVVADVNSLIAYQDIIQPILKSKCMSCHNNGKQKGGLNMSNKEDLMKGGDEGPILITGAPTKSPLINRMHLPLEEKKHMPPKGKKQPTENELKLLQWWIAENASFDKKIGDISQTEEITTILKSYEQSASAIDTRNLKPLDAERLHDLKNKGINIMPLDLNSPLASVSFSRDTLLKNSKINKLKGIKDNIAELDLSFTSADDKLLKQLVKFKNLQKLKLQNTRVTSKGLKHLEKLQNLKDLNLYNTQIDNEAFESISKLATLESLYLWQTKVTKEKVAEFKNNNPRINVNYGVDPSVFGDSQLKPPIIKAEKDIFSDTLSISLSLNFKNVDVYYTLDGSEPDSTSLKYDSTFVINETSHIKAISSKASWTTSEPSEKVFTKAGHAIQNITLAKPPNDKYKAKGAKSLVDFEKGSTSFVDGKWLGYEGENMTATLDLGETNTVSNVVVSSLQGTGSYIFFPKGLEVATSIDGKTFTTKGKLDIPIAKGPEPPELKSFILDFEPYDARYVKVKVLGTLKNPDWHAAPGAKNWIFVDEIIVN